MENSNKAAVVPADMGWSDVGSWDALWEITPQEEHGFVILGDVMTEHVENSYIRSENKLVAAIGLKDTILVSTDDAVLVVAKNHAQKVKNLVENLKEKASNLHKFHTKIYRPWGWYQSLEKGERYQVKLLF